MAIISIIREWMRMIRWNLLACLVALVIVTWRLFNFAESLLVGGNLVEGNQDVILVGLFGLLSTAISGIIGYATGMRDAIAKKDE